MKPVLGKEVEMHRVVTGKMGSDASYGRNGAFIYGDFFVIISDQRGWEHVSVSRKDRTPTWEEMVRFKNEFWGPEETVIQYHPPESQYVNRHPYCLHLWKPAGAMIPLPPKELIG